MMNLRQRLELHPTHRIASLSRRRRLPLLSCLPFVPNAPCEAVRNQLRQSEARQQIPRPPFFGFLTGKTQDGDRTESEAYSRRRRHRVN